MMNDPMLLVAHAIVAVAILLLQAVRRLADEARTVDVEPCEDTEVADDE